MNNLKIAIVGRKKDCKNYEDTLLRLGMIPITTLRLSHLHDCAGMILPGGGDINPAFFGQKMTHQGPIDTELDILQFQALDLLIREEKPVLGICKGMQLINVAFGGTIVQDMPDSSLHKRTGGDLYHDTRLMKNTIFQTLYGDSLKVNSAHHQCIDRPGKGIVATQFAPDGIVEGIMHESLPIYGVQWHPERLYGAGEILLRLFLSRCAGDKE